MISTTPRSLWQSLAAIAAAGAFVACTEGAPVAPATASASPSAAALLTSAEAQATHDGRIPDLGSCQQDLELPAGSKVSFHAFGIGVQIYHWNGVKWDFVNPSADLFANADGTGLVGTHFGGPTWLTLSGSRVVGTITGRCTPNPDAIAWLRLDAAADGAGVFANTTIIQRLNTVGGNAPARQGAVDETVRVPYTADYYFYRTP